MNPLTNMKNIKKLSEQELNMNLKTSWHDQYKDSAWIFVGGLPYDLTEGDIICIFSQYGEIVNINLIRDKDTGKSKGFCFICYEDQRSTILAVDNFNGIKVLGRILRVDHVNEYKVPKEGKKTDEETKRLYREGCAPQTRPPVSSTEVKSVKIEADDIRETLADQISGEIRLPLRLPIYPVKEEKDEKLKTEEEKEKKKKKKKEKKKKKKSAKRKSSSDKSDSSSEESSNEKVKVSRKRNQSDSTDEEREKRKKPKKGHSESNSSESDDTAGGKHRKRKEKHSEEKHSSSRKHRKEDGRRSRQSSDNETCDGSDKETESKRKKYSEDYSRHKRKEYNDKRSSDYNKKNSTDYYSKKYGDEKDYKRNKR